MGLILSACAPKVPNEPPAATMSPISSPLLGSTMAWVDGSTLVYIPMIQADLYSPCDASGVCAARLDVVTTTVGQQTAAGSGVWVTLNPINNYQFSLCVQAGDCKPPTTAAYDDPSKETAPVSIVGSASIGPDHSAGYCAWIGGRVPTDAEIAAMGDASVHTALGGTDLIGNLHCVVDDPLPRPMYFQTSPYYEPGTSMTEMLAQPSGNHTFCQGSQSFATLDLTLPLNHSIQSINGDGHTQCSQVAGGRILCGGVGGSNPQVDVKMQCNERGVFGCQPGSDLQTAGCSNNMHTGAIAGMDDWEMGSNGALIPVNGHQLPNGAWTAPITHPMHLINGVMVVESLPSNGLPVNGLPGNGAPSNGIPSNGANSNGALLPAVCPVGFFSDSSASTCTSLGAPVTTCLDGFTYDPATKTCKSAKAGGNYPGCPMGQLFDPSSGVCDAHTQIVSGTELIHTQSFKFNLLDCSQTRKKNSSGDSSTGGPSGGVPGCIANCP